MCPGIPIVQSFLVGQDQQQVGHHQVGHQRSEGVVVAETDLLVGDGIVLVHHRDRTQRQQRLHRAASVEIACTVREVVVGQQNLRGVQTVARELPFVGLDQAHLPHRRGSLQQV
jgi:hypothetical protein